MKNNYLPTSNPSGLVQAPRSERYFIQKLSRQGKSAGNWIYINKEGFTNKEEACIELHWKESCYLKDRFRIWLSDVFV